MMRTFYKYHGIGNDYIYFDCFEEELKDPGEVARRLSDRRFSVGGDGVVCILKSDVADAKMRMFNADGSEGKMCGNAIRCVGKYLHDVRGLRKKKYTIETLAGIRTLELIAEENGRALAFTVDMGRPVLAPERIPAMFPGKRIVDRPLIVGDRTYRVTCVSMGNPHCVVFCDGYSLDLETVGPMFETHPAFPERVNTEFVKPLGRNERGQFVLGMRVWERGSGETWACGTGACAAAVAAVLNGYAELGSEIVVRLKGGLLTIVYTGKTVLMSGPAAFAFKGEAEL